MKRHARLAFPTYRTPTFHEVTKGLPRIVNLQWLSMAITDQLAAIDSGECLPWDDAQLLAAARFVVNQTLAGGESLTIHTRRRRTRI